MKFEIDYKIVGERIKKCRLNNNITQDTLADLIEVNPSFISNIERGKTKMSMETFVNIAKTLNTSVDYLIFGDVILEHDQHRDMAVLEIQNILKDKDKNEVQAFVDFFKNFSEFLSKIHKW